MIDLAKIVQETGRIPLAWAGSTQKMDYLNFGDALSPVMVAMVAGKPIDRVPFRSLTPRLAAVGTIAHGLEGGDVWFWGSGCSNYRNPGAKAEERVPYQVPDGTRVTISATRGPVSRDLLGGAGLPNAVYGDPVWLLPRFYEPTIEKRYELGVILHLSELTDRSTEAHPNPNFKRYDRYGGDVDRIRLINTVTDISLSALRDKVDEILSCKRIVSTSLHGMVIAESYGIPCLYFPPNGVRPGLGHVEPTIESGLDLRIVDLYQGLGIQQLPVYVQDRYAPTDWDDLLSAIDRTWQPVDIDGDALMQALPMEISPLAAPAGGTIFDHPLLNEIVFQHDVAELGRADRARSGAFKPAAPAVQVEKVAPSFGEQVAARGAVPLGWVAPTVKHPYPNLGDGLSPVMVAAITGLPIERRHFDDTHERMVAVGTIGHAQKHGTVHFWGTGVDAENYTLPTDTNFAIHAVRGPRSAATLRCQGLTVPEIYGDPVWFLPKILPRPAAPPTWDLGIIVHISELDSAMPDAGTKPEFERYVIPESLHRSVKIINTFTDRSVEGMFNKVDEILSCKRIASTSFHGLLIADTYGIPCVWFGTYAGGGRLIDIKKPQSAIDHRVHDFYSTTDRTALPAYCQTRNMPTDWAALMEWIDKSWTPAGHDAAPLFDALPIAKAVSLDAAEWPLRGRVLGSLIPPLPRPVATGLTLTSLSG
jgi:hypothetical protein